MNKKNGRRLSQKRSAARLYGKTESIALTSAAGGEAVFEAESFSIYVIKYHEDDTVETETERIIYHFLSPRYVPVEENGNTVYKAGEYRFPNKHNDLVSTQILKDGESG